MITPPAYRQTRPFALLQAIVMAALLAVLTTACGHRGPLYLPNEPPAPTSATDADSGEAAPGAEEAEVETRDDSYGHEGDEEDGPR